MLSAGVFPATAEDDDSERDSRPLLDAARKLFSEHKYLEGRAAAERIVKESPDSSDAGEAAKYLKNGAVVLVEKIHDSGNSNRLNIVFVAEGYTNLFENNSNLNGDGAVSNDEQALFDNDVSEAAAELFSESPWKESRGLVNIWKINVSSTHAGADWPLKDIPVFRDTAFGAAHKFRETPRLLTVDYDAVATLVNENVNADFIVVLVNAAWGGSGKKGMVVVGINRYGEPGADKEWTRKFSMRNVLHELGHACGLADEYEDPADEGMQTASGEPPFPNVTTKSKKSEIKWKKWIDPDTPTPTTGVGSWVGAYEGAYFHRKGYFRSQIRCLMRKNCDHFCVVCRERILRMIFERVRVADSAHPAAEEILMDKDETLKFSMVPAGGDAAKYEFEWLLDGKTFYGANNSVISIHTVALARGVHALDAVVRVKSEFLRDGGDGIPEYRRLWRIKWK